ncbi:Uncharacterized protein SAMN05421819_2673 [Bryocella elongata]|uniref:Photosynthesis system II assembly factor Ycf48/Hcf136-like domain-containing protein n=1 Tax=Bryocella elongata TaxID=863522 RepID=A0A1H5ZHT0_9BACT|nr:hypothetical protein [Bryocella elongata]SEG36083.1 Uncharacterized protein SAMN05421819_2673 [Bryocella elongata]
MRPELLLASLLTFATASAPAQWQILDAHTTASLRGVHNVGQGIVWASGTNGTVLRSIDDGKSWTTCTTPPDADKLDFRGIQAFDANTAIVMSSGKGDLSRLYKTSDGCKTWRLVFTNPDKDGFWDAIYFEDHRFGALLGDPVQGRFVLFNTRDAGEHWERRDEEGLRTDPATQGAFAASNSSLIAWTGLTHRFFVTGGTDGAYIHSCNGSLEPSADRWEATCFRTRLPLARAKESSGAFSIAVHETHFVVVGGNYKSPDRVAEGAAWSTSGESWDRPSSYPHGYRSAVAYDAPSKTWITVGPNGTDISTDDGRNWQALKPDTKAGDAPDADQNWNALSLPFVVGPHGRIGKLRPDALHQPLTHPTKRLATGNW